MGNRIPFDDLPKRIQTLVHLLVSQNPESIEQHGWTSVLDYVIESTPENIYVKLPEICIGFCFKTDGEFCGIYNWKE